MIRLKSKQSCSPSEAANDVASDNQVFRFDGRCGVDAPLPNGAPAQCDASGEYFCCSKYGHCGNTEEHCNCADCIDFRSPRSPILKGFVTTNHILHSLYFTGVFQIKGWILAYVIPNHIFKIIDTSTTEEPTSKATTEMVDEWDAWIIANGTTVKLQFHYI